MSRPRRLRILHLHSSFGRSDNATRSVQLINACGRGCEHGIVSAASDEMAAATGIDRGMIVDLAVDCPSLSGRPTPRRLQRLAQVMQDHDLVLTYGYGAIDAAMAHTMCGGTMPLPPLVHHEDDGDGDGAPSLARNWYRRIALGRATAVVVPSRGLEAVAVEKWHQPLTRVKRITPGIATAAYAAKPRRDALPRVIKRGGELWLGTLADLTLAHDLIGLVRAFAALPEAWQLVIVGEGPQRDAIRNEALRLDLGHRVHLPGSISEPSRVLGLFDLFAWSSDSARFPTSLAEAMAAGLAIAAIGDVAALLAQANRPFVVAPNDTAALATALQTLAAAPDLRVGVGAANRRLARAEYDRDAMIAAYRTVYAAALGQHSFP